MEQATESELVLAARTGDKVAFGHLVEQHLFMVRQVALRLVGNQEVAWELAQDALLQAYLSLAKLREPAHFQRWLYGIVRNLCRSYLRSRQRTAYSWELLTHENQQPLTVLMDTDDPQAIWEAAERSYQIRTALATLSDKNRTAMWLFYFEQLSIEEIAMRLGVSANAVKGRLHQSRKQLRAQLASLVEPVYRPVQTTISTNKRNQPMHKITDLRLLQREAEGYNLYLFDTAGACVLPMFIGPDEGWQLQQYLPNEASVQPLPYHYGSTILHALGVQMQAVRIERLQQFLFYAVVQLRNGEQTLEVEVRPSDAIVNALHAGAPIYVADTVMASNGLSLPQPIDIDRWFYTEASAFVNVQQRTTMWQAKSFGEDEHTYTQQARAILNHAVSAAKVRNHNYVGTEHLLLGLVQEEGTIAAQLLHTAGAPLPKVIQAVERVGRGKETPTAEPALVPRLIQVLDYAAAAQVQGNQPAIDAEHLLLGLIHEGRGMAMTILHELGVDGRQLQAKLIESRQSSH